MNPLQTQLSARQREVVQALADGAPEKAVAVDLGISAKTVSKHKQAAYRRLHIHDRCLLTQFALAAGLITNKFLLLSIAFFAAESISADAGAISVFRAGDQIQFWIYQPSPTNLPLVPLRFEFSSDLKTWQKVGNETAYGNGWRMTETSIRAYTNGFFVRFRRN